MSKIRPCGADKKSVLTTPRKLSLVLKELETRTKERDDAFEEVKWLRNELEELCRLSGWIIDEDGDGDGPHWERAIQRILQTTPDERKGK